MLNHEYNHVPLRSYSDRDLGWIEAGSGNGSVHESTKALPDPMLIYHQVLSGIHITELFHKKCS